jgi:hypothetical protein
MNASTGRELTFSNEDKPIELFLSVQADEFFSYIVISCIGATQGTYQIDHLYMAAYKLFSLLDWAQAQKTIFLVTHQ